MHYNPFPIIVCSKGGMAIPASGSGTGLSGHMSTTVKPDSSSSTNNQGSTFLTVTSVSSSIFIINVFMAYISLPINIGFVLIVF